MTTLGADTDNVVGRPTSPQTVTAPSQVERNKGPNERATQKSARTEGNNGPKLRSSCKSCASSRVRCNKEKPICSRCEARGLDCQYLQSKRPGRVPGSSARRLQHTQPADRPGVNDRTISQDSTADLAMSDQVIVRSDDGIQRTLPSPLSSGNGADCPTINNHFRVDSIFSASDALPDAGFFASALDMNVGTTAPLDTNNVVSQPDSLGMLSTMDDISYGDFTAYETELGGLNSWWPFDDKTTDLAQPNVINSQLLQSTSASVSTDKSTEPSSQVPSSLPSGVNLRDLTIDARTSAFIEDDLKRSPPNLPTFAQPARQETVAFGSCQCMVQGLDLLKSLLTDPQPSTTPMTSDSYTQRILAENKQAIDANLVTLVCPSCNDGKFVLMLILMITTKVLARYAAAAALCSARTLNMGAEGNGPMQMSTAAPNPAAEHTERLVRMSRAWGASFPTGLNVGATDQSPPREAVQRVLRELHQVQRLLVALVARRKTLSPGEVVLNANAMPTNSPTSSGNRSNNGSQHGLLRSSSYDSADQSASIAPLSVHALDVVESDVRKSLGALSAVVRAVLRCS